MANLDPRRGLPSASAMYRVKECRGSEALIASLRAEHTLDERPSLDALSGQRIHAVLVPNRPDNVVIPATDAELAIAKDCVKIREQLIEEWQQGTTRTPFLVIAEERFFYYDDEGNARFTGQPDFVAIDLKGLRALIVNYKTGRRESTHAADNLQLRTEVVLLKHKYKELTEIDAAIDEPNVDWDPVRVRYSDQDGSLAAAEADIVSIVTLAQMEPQQRRAGAWCEYCPARAYCPEAQALVRALVQYEMVRVQELPRGPAGTAFWEQIRLVKKLIEKLELAYHAILEKEPDALPGWTLPHRGPMHWLVPYPAEFRQAFKDYLTDAEIDGALTWNIGKLRELFGMKHRLKGVRLEMKFKEVAGDSIKRRAGAPYIRPLTKKEKQLLDIQAHKAELEEENE